MPRALAVDAIQPGRSPLSRFEAAERRSREHGSDHTDICRHGDELAASLLLTKLVQPHHRFRRSYFLRCTCTQYRVGVRPATLNRAYAPNRILSRC